MAGVAGGEGFAPGFLCFCVAGELRHSTYGTRAILIRDVDRRFIELRQPTSVSGTGTALTTDILDMRLMITVNDMDETKRAYRDVLGFTVGNRKNGGQTPNWCEDS